MIPSEAFIKLFEALYGPLINAISVGLELPSDLEFQVRQQSKSGGNSVNQRAIESLK